MNLICWRVHYTMRSPGPVSRDMDLWTPPPLLANQPFTSVRWLHSWKVGARGSRPKEATHFAENENGRQPAYLSLPWRVCAPLSTGGCAAAAPAGF